MVSAASVNGYTVNGLNSQFYVDRIQRRSDRRTAAFQVNLVPAPAFDAGAGLASAFPVPPGRVKTRLLPIPIAMAMTRYLLRRLAILLLSLLAAAVVLFVLLRLLPGDPAAALVGVGATEEQIAARGRKSAPTSRSASSS